MDFTTTEELANSDPEYPEGWPPEEYYNYASEITRDQVNKLTELVESNSNETKIDSFLRENQTILTSPLDWGSTGHHGAWVLSQQTIRMNLTSSKPGLIPDFIIGGRNSGGFSWWIVELKGANHKYFVEKGNHLKFSDQLNKGICQTLSYIDYCDEIQSFIRDQIGLNNFREPKGLILIGRSSEFEKNEQKRKLKSVWNRSYKSKLEIRTYDALASVANKLCGHWQE